MHYFFLYLMQKVMPYILKPLVESSDLMPLISVVFSNLLLWRRKILKSSSQNCFRIYIGSNGEKYENGYQEGYF